MTTFPQASCCLSAGLSILYRSSNEVKLEVPLVNGTFQDTAAVAFNNLPGDIRNCTDFHICKRKVRVYLSTLAADRLTR